MFLARFGGTPFQVTHLETTETRMRPNHDPPQNADRPVRGAAPAACSAGLTSAATAGAATTVAAPTVTVARLHGVLRRQDARPRRTPTPRSASTPAAHDPASTAPGTAAVPSSCPFAGSRIYYRGYQCIELVARYLKARYNADPGVANGAQAVDRYAAAYPATFVKIANGTKAQGTPQGRRPQPLGQQVFNDVGHTGIVISSSVNSAGNGTIRAVEQNWGGTGGTSGYHVYTVKSWRVTLRRPALRQVAAGTLSSSTRLELVLVSS